MKIYVLISLLMDDGSSFEFQQKSSSWQNCQNNRQYITQMVGSVLRDNGQNIKEIGYVCKIK